MAPINYWLMHAWASVTPFQWGMQVVATAALWIVADVAVVLAFRALWGWGWPTAAAYACYAVSTFTLPSFLWASQVWLGSMAVLSQLWIRIQDNVVGVRRVFALMDLAAETDKGTQTLAPVTQGVKAQSVSLVYPDGRKALEGVDFEAKVGEITAIVGPTGAGKTSLAYLIPRFHVATEGAVTVGQPIMSEPRAKREKVEDIITVKRFRGGGVIGGQPGIHFAAGDGLNPKFTEGSNKDGIVVIIKPPFHELAIHRHITTYLHHGNFTRRQKTIYAPATGVTRLTGL